MTVTAARAAAYARKAGSVSLTYHVVRLVEGTRNVALCRKSYGLDDNTRTYDGVLDSTYGNFCMACRNKLAKEAKAEEAKAEAPAPTKAEKLEAAARTAYENAATPAEAIVTGRVLLLVTDSKRYGELAEHFTTDESAEVGRKLLELSDSIR